MLRIGKRQNTKVTSYSHGGSIPPHGKFLGQKVTELTAPTRDAFIALASTDLTNDLQNVAGVLLKNAYPDQSGLRPEEYCAISRFRFFVSSKAAKIPGASLQGATVYTIPMYGLEAAAKIDQNNYTAHIGYRPPYVVSSVAQNSQLYAKFAIARAITNQNWISGLNVTASLV